MTNQHARHTYLKIKLLSLAAEARIIRREEQRWPGKHHVRTGLHEHHVPEVRKEARCALLAYGFLRGRPYRRIEPKGHRAPGWKRTQQLVEKYGDPRSLHRCLPAHRRPDQLWAVEGRQRGSALKLTQTGPIRSNTSPQARRTGEQLDRHQCPLDGGADEQLRPRRPDSALRQTP